MSKAIKTLTKTEDMSVKAKQTLQNSFLLLMWLVSELGLECLAGPRMIMKHPVVKKERRFNSFSMSNGIKPKERVNVFWFGFF